MVGELREIFGRHVLADDRRQVTRVHPRDQHEVPVRIVGQLLEQHLVHDHRGRNRPHQRVAVRRCVLHLLGGDGAARARLVLDEDRLAGFLGNVLAIGAREDVGEATGGIAADDADRFAGPGFLSQGGRRQGSRDRPHRAIAQQVAPRRTDHSHPPCGASYSLATV